MSNGARATVGSRIFCVAFVLAALIFYAIGVPGNPPGFYIDESSIAFNAHTIAQHGIDEYGIAWPLYFRCFGEYKNAPFIYLLAAVFQFTGPSILVARLVSASLGAGAALLIGWLALRMTQRVAVAALVALSALLTPWLYECSRLVFEVAAYPLVTALFLLAVWNASRREEWSALDVVCIAGTLALLTYTYSIGRLLGPLLALGLVCFITRANFPRVVQTWLLFALTLVPLALFASQHPGALSGRFSEISYINGHASIAENLRSFVLHYLRDLNPSRWLLTGEENIRDHIPDTPALLLATWLLALGGIALVVTRHRRDRWWPFVIYGLGVSFVPAALTMNDFPQLRLITVPIFLHVLAIPEADTLLTRRFAFTAAGVLLLGQGAQFQWRFHVTPPERWYVFDARFARTILEPALNASGDAPIYLQDPPHHSGYIQALWHGALRGVDASHFRRLTLSETAPPNAVVISAAEECENCRLLARSINFILYAVRPTDLAPTAPPLPRNAIGAELALHNIPVQFAPGESRSVEVIVRNRGRGIWPAVGEENERGAVRLHARWRTPEGETIGSETITRIPYDMEPGDTAGLSLRVTAPEAQGDYLLELELVQEEIVAFGAENGGKKYTQITVRAP